MKGDDYLLVSEAAEFLGVASNTVRKWAADGKLKEYRHPVNNYRLFKKLDVEKLLRQIQNPISEPQTKRQRRSGDQK